jgi:hypothetical protein
MPNATVRANARTLPEATTHSDAALFVLAEQCIAAHRVRLEAADALEKAEERCLGCANPPVIIRTDRDKALGLYVGNRAGTAYTRDDVRRYVVADDAYDNLAERLLITPAKTIEGVLAKARVMQHVSVAVDMGAALQERMRRMGPDEEAFTTSLARDLISCASPGGALMNAAPVDPVFAAIAQHIVARDALIEAIPRADGVTAKREGHEVTKADKDAVEALNLDEEAAFLKLFVIVPTTLEGRRALLQHLVQRDEDGISEPIGEIATKMLRLPMFAA